jgi:hypothetical protein
MHALREMFTKERYFSLIKQIYASIDDLILLRRQPGPPIDRDRWEGLADEVTEMCRTYREELPRYELARCPFCHEAVYEVVDTYSLEGPGWFHESDGFGWFGLIPKDTAVGPSYDSRCPHIGAVVYSVNLNQAQPSEIFGKIHANKLYPRHVVFGGEKPLLFKNVLNLPDTCVVGRNLSVAHLSRESMSFQMHICTYFSKHLDRFEKEFRAVTPEQVRYLPRDYGDTVYAPLLNNQIFTRPLRRDLPNPFIPYWAANNDLHKWHKLHKLFWMTENASQLSLTDDVHKLPVLPDNALEGRWEVSRRDGFKLLPDHKYLFYANLDGMALISKAASSGIISLINEQRQNRREKLALQKRLAHG